MQLASSCLCYRNIAPTNNYSLNHPFMGSVATFNVFLNYIEALPPVLTVAAKFTAVGEWGMERSSKHVVEFVSCADNTSVK